MPALLPIVHAACKTGAGGVFVSRFGIASILALGGSDYRLTLENAIDAAECVDIVTSAADSSKKYTTVRISDTQVEIRDGFGGGDPGFNYVCIRIAP